MTQRRPLVVISGQVRELPTTDSLPVVGTLAFYKSNGARDDINMTSDNKIPFFKTTGVASNIPMVLA